MTSLKLVKNARLEKEGKEGSRIFQVVHYNTIIFSYDELTKIATARTQCSHTSDKQIRFAKSFFNPSKVIETKNPEKYGFHGEYQQ